jgi:thiol-disulfide isomerase/thioredoxin
VVPAISLITVFAALGVATGLGLVWQRRNGRFSSPVVPVSPSTLADLGWQAGTPVTLLQFSSAFCAPCRATRVLCEQTAATVPGVRHIEVDAESHLAAVRELDIMRTPTVLLIDAGGVIVRRASGQPTRSQLVSAVGIALGNFAIAD